MKVLPMIGVVVNYGECARDCPESIWDFSLILDILISSILQFQYSAYVPYTVVPRLSGP